MTNLHHILLTLLFAFSSIQKPYSLNAEDVTITSSYNGAYEGIIATSRSKSLVRLHVFVYNYPNTKYRDLYDRVAKKTIRPKTMVGLLEVYDNKKGRGTPKRSYFTAITYESSSELIIDYMAKSAGEQNGQIKLNISKVSKFNIPKNSSQEFEMKVGYSYQGKYRKISTYQKVPVLFNPYFEEVLKEAGKRSRGKVNLGSTGYKSVYKVYSENPNPNQRSVKATFTYPKTGNFSLDNPAISWIENIEYELKKCLKNKSFGAHENLKYLPNTEELAIYITPSSYSNTTNIHFFNVGIERKNDRLDFNVSRTSAAKAYVNRARLADNNRRQEAQRKRQAAEEKEARLRQKEKELQLAEQRVQALKSAQTNGGERFSINTTGLTHASLIQHLFEGEFDKLDFTRDETAFGAVFSGYVRAFSRNCKSSLPNDKIQLMKSECEREQITTNGYGVEISRVCVKYRKIPTGIFASPKVYRAYETLTSAQTVTTLANYFSMLGNPERLGDITKDAFKAREIIDDIEKLLTINGCESKAIKRLENNIIAYIYNEPPLTFGQNNASRLTSGGVDYSTEIDYSKLMNDLFYADSKSWMFKYVPGYVTIKSIQKVSGRNIPSRIEANYRYETSSGGRRDTAVLTFKNGIPDCITYPSFFTPCKAVNRQVIAKLRQGYYNKKSW
ncbi:hypothetical protein APS56_15920 [Pseudalgibacter alginicilyticus]|uniref:Uncharacterized protein n=1 Tax=Pseudalgibacter alginicilyticus TaxID=1736674 RepID=A0A0P0DEG2_9FLAO|nr:hypothetical protein [Pseudalgibacter alginicilyticus]ALJ06529.1 hypothetical protein APS56_15920 [Pseudalgibacter alginicilyticus]